MNWVCLLLAGALEVCWAVGMKMSHGFTRLTPSVITVTAMIASIGLLAFAMRTIPLGTAYAVWTGIGAVGTVVVGMCFFHESASLLRISCLGMILLGIIGLKLIDSFVGPVS